MIYTTLNQIRAQGPCGVGREEPPTGFRKLLAHLGRTEADDEALSFATILTSNGLDDALWCLRCVDEPAFCRRLAVKFAREVQHLMRDPRSIAALDVAERHASGLASDDELAEARTGANSAAAAAAATATADADAAATAAAYYSAAYYSAAATAAAAAAAAAAASTYAAYAYAAYAYAYAKESTYQRQTEIFFEELQK